ncbi:MAG: hypothetical protein J6P94_04345 [Oscillospiraceae bacterium]|nr:hypothetical protein [Oscillospiraceae bacterium]
MNETTYRFRSSLGGYHKGDVTAYIEKTAAEHRSELLTLEQKIAELMEENRSLQQQLNIMMMVAPMVTPAPALEVEAEPELEPAPAPEAEPMQEEAAPAEASELMHKELQAYRRAEAVERIASKRAKQFYEKMEELRGGALEDFQAADAAVKQTIELLMAQASSLEKAYQDLSSALNASCDHISAINEDFYFSDDEEE